MDGHSQRTDARLLAPDIERLYARSRALREQARQLREAAASTVAEARLICQHIAEPLDA